MNTAANGNAAKVLDVCRHFLGQIRVAPVADLAGLSQHQVTDSFQILVERGLVKRVLRGVFRLTPDGFAALVEPFEIKSGPKGPRVMDLPQTCIRTRAWRALRLCRKGSVQDLLMLASQGSEIQPGDIKQYLNILAKSGFLTRLSKADVNKQTRYLLVRDTGPKAPQWNKRQKRVFDANTGEIHELA